jgi:hypothetical protein
MTPKQKQEKKNRNTLHFTKIKPFRASKLTIKKVERQPMEWEKIFAIHISNQGLTPRI